VFSVTGGVVVEAARRRGIPIVPVSRADVACVMAGVSGALAGAPGAAVIGGDLGEAHAGLTCAFLDRAPSVVITSGASAAGGADLGAVTKATLGVGADSAAHWIAHACQLAMKEPWGPVHLDVPDATAAAAALPVATSCRPAPLPAPAPDVLDAAARTLESAERPVLVVGRLCRSAAEAAWIRAFAEARPAPVLVTPKARGVLPDPHPLVIGTLGAGDAERALLESADLVVAVAVDPLELPPDAWPMAMAVLELTPVASAAPPPVPGRTVVVGDVGLILEELAPRLRERRSAEWDVARLHALKQSAAAPPVDARRLAAHRVVEAARRLTPAGAIAVFEGSDVWMAAARAWQAVAPGECLISSGAATTGFAVAAATAAQLARPERRVICFTDSLASRAAGDQLTIMAALGLPVLIVVGGAASPTATPSGLRRFTAASTATFPGLFAAALAASTPVLVTAHLGS
jgi:acetolactate synthase-1/2/3 large subunit